MALPFYNWSKTAASNATADSTVNWAEGQAPSSVNDSARAMMASTAAFRDDTSGALVTGGTSTAYTLTTNQVFASKALMNGAELSFTVNATNGASPTLNVDGLGGDPITLDGTNVVPTGTLIVGSVYTAVYYFSGTAWRLKDFYQLPFTVPIGGMIDFFGTTTPNSAFVFPYGQAISRSTYSTLFGLFSTTYGTGDGSTTFNVPDLRGRVVAGLDGMGGSLAGRLDSTGGMSGTGLGSVGGAQTKSLTTANLPPYTPSGNVTTTINNNTTSNFNASAPSGGTQLTGNATLVVTASSSFSGIAQGGTSTAFTISQPTIAANKLLRII